MARNIQKSAKKWIFYSIVSTPAPALKKTNDQKIYALLTEGRYVIFMTMAYS